MTNKHKSEPLSAITVLEYLRDDVRQMEWNYLAEDGRTILVPKADVLQFIQDWMEHCLNPARTVLATEEMTA